MLRIFVDAMLLDFLLRKKCEASDPAPLYGRANLSPGGGYHIKSRKGGRGRGTAKKPGKNMAKKIRLIARLDVKDENLVKGIQLEGLRRLGRPGDFAREYYETGIDELLYIDIVASLYGRSSLHEILRETSENLFIPVTVGGGLRSVEDVRAILQMGADKAAICTAAIRRPALLCEAAAAFGSQCITLSIQAKRSRTDAGRWEAYYNGGREHSGLDVVEWAKRGEELGAGEILLTSVDCEGMQRGMDLALVEAVSRAVSVPVILGGGAGSAGQIAKAARAGADAVAVASVLHYKKATVPGLKAGLLAAGVEVRRCG